MNETLTDRLFCFSEDEFSVLADACGLRTMYGFDMREQQSCESIEIRYNRSIAALYNKGVLVPERGGLIIYTEAMKIFACIRNAGHILKLIDCDGTRAPVCIYPGEDGIAYMRPSMDGVNYISMGFRFGESLGRFLEASDYLPDAEASAEIICLREQSGDALEVPEEAFDRLPGIIFHGALVENVTHLVMRRAAVVRKGFEDILVIDTPCGSRTAELYTKKRFIDSICVKQEDRYDSG